MSLQTYFKEFNKVIKMDYDVKSELKDKIEKNISGYRISGTLKVIEPAAVSVPVSKTQGD